MERTPMSWSSKVRENGAKDSYTYISRSELGNLSLLNESDFVKHHVRTIESTASVASERDALKARLVDLQFQLESQQKTANKAELERTPLIRKLEDAEKRLLLAKSKNRARSFQQDQWRQRAEQSDSGATEKLRKEVADLTASLCKSEQRCSELESANEDLETELHEMNQRLSEKDNRQKQDEEVRRLKGIIKDKGEHNRELFCLVNQQHVRISQLESALFSAGIDVDTI